MTKGWIAAVVLVLAAPMAGAGEGTLTDLIERMTGSFSSAAQAVEDPDFFDIRLEMVRIWPDSDEAVWLYVEQAAASSLDKPYRQRVYRLTPLPDGTFESKVFSIPDPLRFAGDWRSDDPLAGVTPDDLEIREGCAVFLRWSDEGFFEGSTRDRECVSTLRGASYATSEVTVRFDAIVSWDRGFDVDGNQVWGAEKGGYVFLKE
jgi:hypothetical protein